MLNALRPQLARFVTPAGEALARTGITPNAITVIGTVGVAGGALGFFPRGELFPGALVAAIFSLADMLDGAVARVTGTTGPWGAFLDSTFDRIGDAAIFGGIMLWFYGNGHDSLLGGVALFCLVCGGLVSYVKARAEGLGMRCDVGLAERAERMLIGLVSTGLAGLGVPYVLPIGLWVLAAASAITFGQRLLQVRRQVHAPNAGV